MNQFKKGHKCRVEVFWVADFVFDFTCNPDRRLVVLEEGANVKVGRNVMYPSNIGFPWSLISRFTLLSNENCSFVFIFAFVDDFLVLF